MIPHLPITRNVTYTKKNIFFGYSPIPSAAFRRHRPLNHVEPFFRNNRGKHWVDNINNRLHDPIELETTWKTKRWPNCQLTFFLLFAEVNSIQAPAHLTSKEAVSTLDLHKKLTMGMLWNNILANGLVAAFPPRP